MTLIMAASGVGGGLQRGWRKGKWEVGLTRGREEGPGRALKAGGEACPPAPGSCSPESCSLPSTLSSSWIEFLAICTKFCSTSLPSAVAPHPVWDGYSLPFHLSFDLPGSEGAPYS